MDTFDWLKMCILVLAEFEGKDRTENLGWDKMMDELHTGNRAAESEDDEIAIWVFYSVISRGNGAARILQYPLQTYPKKRNMFIFLLIILQKKQRRRKNWASISLHPHSNLLLRPKFMKCTNSLF